MSEVKVNKISPRSGTDVTLGDAADTFTIPASATLDVNGTIDVTGATVTGLSGITANQDDIALLGFKVAANGSLAKYNLVDQTVDDFQDTSGVNASSSTNETRDASGKYYSGAVSSGNYFGDSSDGSVTTSGDVTYTVANKSGSYDGDMYVAEYSALTVSTGDTITVDQPCRGLFIMVAGDCTINGTISMDAKGGSSDPTASGGSDSNAVGSSGLQVGYETSGGSSSFTNDGTGFNGAGNAVRTALGNIADLSSSGTIFTVSKAGASGAAASGPATGGGLAGIAGGAGTTGGITLSTGGGAGGAAMDRDGHGSKAATSGGGGNGGAFSAGSGGGAAASSSSPVTASAGSNYSLGGGAGAGAPNGARQGGGLIYLVVKGNLTIGASGVVTAKGEASANQTGFQDPTAGSAGSGAIFVLYGGTLSNSGSITAAGTLAGTEGSSASRGGTGGAGGTHTAAITADSYNNMTLISTTTAAQAAPTKGDIVLTYTNGAGTTTLDTDLTAEISADGGSTWTALALGSEGSTGSHNIATSHDVTISSTITAPWNMAYRVKTLNQAVGKQTRIQAVSLGWS